MSKARTARASTKGAATAATATDPPQAATATATAPPQPEPSAKTRQDIGAEGSGADELEDIGHTLESFNALAARERIEWEHNGIPVRAERIDAAGKLYVRRLDIDGPGLAPLTLSAKILEELRGALQELEPEPPRRAA
jgi:hypothetical protein